MNELAGHLQWNTDEPGEIIRMVRKGTRHWQSRLMLSMLLALMAVDAQAEGHVGQQGTRLNGTTLEPLERISIPFEGAINANMVKLQGVVIDKGQLKSKVPVLQGEQFVGVSFKALVKDEPVTLRIVQARIHNNVYAAPGSPESTSATVWEYLVKVSSGNLGSWGDLCPGAALALPGRWDGALFTYDTSSFSFACLPTPQSGVPLVKGGVAAKCVDWGYPPWVSEDPRLDKTTLSLTESDAIRHYIACTAMATADFCGEARPNTLDGTPITLFHMGNVRSEVMTPNSPPVVSGGPMNDGFYFEAAWALVDAGTGQPITDPRWLLKARVRAQALCLTKKRWATLPPNGTCSIQGPLMDPRTWMDPTGAPTRPRPLYCEEYTVDELKQKGAVLFSYSKYLDVGLYRFKHQDEQAKDTGRFLTTSRILISSERPYYRPDPTFISNAGQYVLDTSIPLGFEGTLFKYDTPQAVLNELQPQKRLLRYRQQGDTGRFLTLVEGEQVPEGYALDQVPADHGVEGHVHGGLWAPNGTRTLYLHVNGGNYMTTTSASVLGFMGLKSMGYMPSLADYAAAAP